MKGVHSKCSSFNLPLNQCKAVGRFLLLPMHVLVSFCHHHPTTHSTESLTPFCSLHSKIQLANCVNAELEQQHPSYN